MRRKFLSKYFPVKACPGAFLFNAMTYRKGNGERGWEIYQNAESVVSKRSCKRTKTWRWQRKIVWHEPPTIMIGGYCPVACEECDYIGRHICKFYVGANYEKPWELEGPLQKDLCRKCMAMRVWERNRVHDLKQNRTLINKIGKELSNANKRNAQNNGRNQDYGSTAWVSG